MADLAAYLTAKYFPKSGKSLVIGELPVNQLVESYGTPLFVYDRAVLDLKYDALRTTLPERFAIYYSIKANPCLAVVKHFLSRGCGIEIASAGEFRKALEAGCPPERILFAGPGKSEAELELVLLNGIGEIHMESLTEAKRIATICRPLGRRAQVAVRINPAAEAEGGAMRMGGRPAPFGMDEEILDQVLEAVLAEPALDLCGIHLFTGTQILDAATLHNQYRHGLSLARRVVERLGRPLRTLDFGGGLGIPYFAHEQELNLDCLRKGLLTLCEEVDAHRCFEGTQFLVEPGRFLAGEAGVYLTRISDIKISRGKKFLIVDGGMNHHLAASGNLGQTIKRNYPIALVNKLTAPADEAVDIVGPLCTPLDTLARGIVLPHAEIGDLVGIFQSGAYGRSASPVGFLSHPLPAEIWVDAELHTRNER
ncbi:MAG TPA: type III PLP-dependent enzyme [Candidatus Limnocylindria bacterium]|jgi:diaminopimelate decarboxylase|nr:type III PLP-dependent enzyme [Candidatus Limnocylindria bacterium]